LADRPSSSRDFASVVLEEAGSTNTEAFNRAAAGEAGPLWVVARRQTRGRGRSGRPWSSEPGNLYASLLQRLSCPQSVVHQLSLLAGVAVVEAITAAAGRPVPGIRLKWPNDVLIDGAKCAGILPESQLPGAGSGVVVVIGIGINLATHPDSADIGRAATNLAEHGVVVTPDEMLAPLAQSMERWLGIWSSGANFAAVRAAWQRYGGRAGEGIAVDTGRERIAGTFVDIDDNGALILRDAQGQRRTLSFGDVTILRPVGGGNG
jgi:BirA family biotin operon repressor/biotin-[acetyl-CoA-carboxylase] ligase